MKLQSCMLILSPHGPLVEVVPWLEVQARYVGGGTSVRGLIILPFPGTCLSFSMPALSEALPSHAACVHVWDLVSAWLSGCLG